MWEQLAAFAEALFPASRWAMVGLSSSPKMAVNAGTLWSRLQSGSSRTEIGWALGTST